MQVPALLNHDEQQIARRGFQFLPIDCPVVVRISELKASRDQCGILFSVETAIRIWIGGLQHTRRQPPLDLRCTEIAVLACVETIECGPARALSFTPLWSWSIEEKVASARAGARLTMQTAAENQIAFMEAAP